MSHYSRPVKTGIKLVVAYPTNGLPTIHQAGCSHAKGNRNIREAKPVEYDTEGIYVDDWYQVAPCAASGKGRVCVKYGDACNC